MMCRPRVRKERGRLLHARRRRVVRSNTGEGGSESVNVHKQIVVVGTVVALVLTLSGCQFINTIKAKDNLNQAAYAFNRGEYDTALELLKTALSQDPNLPQLKAYYGATLYAKYNLSGEESLAKEALQVYQEIYEQESQKPNPDTQSLSNAIAYIATIHGSLNNKEEKRKWMLRRADVPGMTDKDKAEIYYILGTEFWGEATTITAKYRINKFPEPEYNVPDAERPKVVELANKGLEYIDRALSLAPEYGDAWTYKNLLLREKAYVERDPQKRKALMDEANKVRDKAIELMKRKQAEQQQQQQQQQ